MNGITFADVVFSHLHFAIDTPRLALLMKVIDCPWVQRLREVSQTANTRLLYMYSEHSRFGHSLGVAYLTDRAIRTLLASPLLDDARKTELEAWRTPVTLAAGSHIAFRMWFPRLPDAHEALGTRILEAADGLRKEVPELDLDLVHKIVSVLNEADDIPAWTWELISGGGWNVDRGNWCVADSILAGVSYGRYNIDAIVESLTITEDGHIALRENRLDAMMHFAVSRHAMYRQIYQHRVLLSADALSLSVVQRAREVLATNSSVLFADEVMEHALRAATPHDLTLEDIFEMRESWWRYHLLKWRRGEDTILADLSDRLINRRLFKTVRLVEGGEVQAQIEQAERACVSLALDPHYYLHRLSTKSTSQGSEQGVYEKIMRVCTDRGETRQLSELDPLFKVLIETSAKEWLAVPKEVKQLLKSP